MKFIFVFFLAGMLSVSASTYSQSTKVSINKTNITINELFNEIKGQTSYSFWYDVKDVDGRKVVSVNAKNKSVKEILEKVLDEKFLEVSVTGNHIVISKKSTTDSVEKNQQSKKQITGTVHDEEGVSIIGASIIEKGTTNGTISDIDGSFTISVAENATLIVSYIGYEKQEIAVRNQTSFQIVLKEDQRLLDEIVVVGYGTQRKRDVAGAISSISNKDLAIQSAGNIQNLLQGRMSGVSVSTSGVAGEAPSIRVRGIGTLGNNQPLYVIDGFPTKSEVAAQINPSSIESVQVLKDASSASIYGAQAANGVILITTKQGKQGRAEVDVKFNIGMQQPVNLPEVLNSKQYGEVLWAAMKNSGMTPSHSQYGNGPTPVIPDYILPAGAFEGEVDLSTYNTAENQYMRANKTGTDWADEVYRLAPTTNIDVSARGGSQDSKYFLSANYLSQDALVKWAGYDRISLRNNSSFSPTKFVTIGTNMSAMYSKYKGATSDETAVRQAPLIPVRDVMGNWAGTKANGLGDWPNPVARIYNQQDNYTDKLNVMANLFLEIKFLDDFQFKTTAGANILNQEGKSFSPKTYWDKGDKNTLVNSLSTNRINTRELMWNNTLNYNKKFLENHSINALLGTEAIKYRYSYLSASRSSFMVEDPDYRYLDAGELNKNNAESAYEYAMFSIFGRINYQYQDKYYLSGILRRDGSSRFGPNNRYGYFPGANAAWRISEESFMADQKIFSDLKLRASYGKTGNQDIGNYGFASLYGTNIGTSSYPITGDVNSVIQGISKETIGNPDIKWETTTQINFGLDAALLANSLNLSFEYYRKNTTDILQRVTYPATGGVASAPYENVGEMQNNGLEFNANYGNTAKNQEFTYDLGLTLSAYRNEVKKLASNQFIAKEFTRSEVGRPISSFYGYVVEGIFQTQDEVDKHAVQTDKAIGRWKYKDVNGDKEINDKDRTYIGSPHPDFEYSLNGRFGYKNFDMTLYIQGTYGNDILFASKGGKDGFDFWSDYFNKSTRILNTWTPENRNAELPEINILNPNNESGKVSSYLVENGSYMRLKFLELGYTIPSQLLSKIYLRHCRVYANVENLFTITNYNNIDPEVKNGDDAAIGVDYVGNMPLARVFSVGFSLTF